MSLEDIDFAERYRTDPHVAGREGHGPSFWDGRAAGMGERAFESSYVREFVARLDLAGCATLLDVGCGPGTIGLSIAPRLAHVYGLDYSPGMLAAFAEQARTRGLSNATPLLRAWEDDWADVPLCDIVVASRATAVRDFEAAAKKLAAKAVRRVYLTYPADGRFAGDGVCEALGRPRGPLPDYLHIVGILHHLGIHPRLDYLEDDNRFAGCAGFDEFLAKVRGLAGELSASDVEIVRGYFDEHRGRIGREKMRWAFISWDAAPPF
jgi:SAM-dependent methyltransferase